MGNQDQLCSTTTQTAQYLCGGGGHCPAVEEEEELEEYGDPHDADGGRGQVNPQRVADEASYRLQDYLCVCVCVCVCGWDVFM